MGNTGKMNKIPGGESGQNQQNPQWGIRLKYTKIPSGDSD